MGRIQFGNAPTSEFARGELRVVSRVEQGLRGFRESGKIAKRDLVQNRTAGGVRFIAEMNESLLVCLRQRRDRTHRSASLLESPDQG